jgi:hypothetical protein
MSFVPAIGQKVLMDQVMRGEARGLDVSLAAAGALAAAFACLAATVRLRQSEKIVFGR